MLIAGEPDPDGAGRATRRPSRRPGADPDDDLPSDDLAVAFAVAFFGEGWVLPGVDDALADALEACIVLSSVPPLPLHPQPSSIAGAAADLLAAVRRRTLAFEPCRQAAVGLARVVEQVVGRVGDPGSVLPLWVALDALGQMPAISLIRTDLVAAASPATAGERQFDDVAGSVVPAVDDAFPLALGPAGPSSLPVDRLLELAASDPAHRPRARAALADHELVLPVIGIDVDPAGLAIEFVTFRRHRHRHVVAFTSVDRFAEFAAASGTDPRAHLAVPGHHLAHLLPAGHAIAVNPGSLVSLSFTEAEIHSIERGPSLWAPGPATVMPVRSTPLDHVVAMVPGVRRHWLGRSADTLVVVVDVDDAGSDPDAAEAGVLAAAGDALVRAGHRDGVVVGHGSALGRAVVDSHERARRPDAPR